MIKQSEMFLESLVKNLVQKKAGKIPAFSVKPIAISIN